MMTPIGALKVADPVKWKATVRDALNKAGGRIAAAAEALGVSGRQLSRWLAEDPDLPRASPGRPWPEGQGERTKAAKKAASAKGGAKKAKPEAELPKRKRKVA